MVVKIEMERPCAKERIKLCRQDGTTTTCMEKGIEEDQEEDGRTGLLKGENGRNGTKGERCSATNVLKKDPHRLPHLSGIKAKRRRRRVHIYFNDSYW